MKLSKLWLGEWVNCSLTEQELAAQLTMAGLEVDAVSPVAGAFTGVVVAKVLSTKQHPNADKLSICEVDANTGAILQIVCGASNVRAGLKVALATIGACLPGDFKIKESKLRGELSQGMLCSLSELGIAESSEGIMELEEDAPLGMNLREYLSLDDSVFDVDLTPNRADCFSVLGIAREVAALNQLPLLEQSILPVTPVIDKTLAVHVANPELCPRYCGRVIRQIKTDVSTPLWMAERLRRCGLRVVHPVVDVMNYVMLELGQPMHAFDLATLEGGIQVRLSKNQEPLELLDGQNITLNDKVLVIADDKKPLAIAGVMGGFNSSVQAHTVDLFLESAFFNPITIAGVARAYGLFSDSSQRYERGVDPSLQIKALERATALIISLVGGQPGPIINACDERFLPKLEVIQFDTSKVKKLTGLSVPPPEIRLSLESLGMKIKTETLNNLEVEIPAHRFDLKLDVDLVEEVIRLYGYDNLKSEPMTLSLQPSHSSDLECLSKELALWFKAKGYNETISYSFVDPELQEVLYPQHNSMQLLNPISSELSQMRLGLWSGLIAAMIYNVHRQQNAVKLFEQGVVFDLKTQQVQERACIAGLLMGERGGLNWSETTRFFDFFDLKGDLQSLFAYLKLEHVTFERATHPALHPGISAHIIIDGRAAGWIGSLHPRLAEALDLHHEVLLFELDVDSLKTSSVPRYQSISKYPQIRRDLSFLVDEQITVGDIEAVVREVLQDNWLKAFDIFDIYMGTNIPAGKKSVAIAMTLQDETRTLVDAEINLLIDAIIKALGSRFSILLRE